MQRLFLMIHCLLCSSILRPLYMAFYSLLLNQLLKFLPGSRDTQSRILDFLWHWVAVEQLLMHTGVAEMRHWSIGSLQGVDSLVLAASCLPGTVTLLGQDPLFLFAKVVSSHNSTVIQTFPRYISCSFCLNVNLEVSFSGIQRHLQKRLPVGKRSVCWLI